MMNFFELQLKKSKTLETVLFGNRMRSRGDVYEAERTSRSDADAASSRSEDDTPLTRQGSQRSGKSLRNEHLADPIYGSDSSSRNPLEYTEQERAELLRRLDSIKDHLLRGNAVDKPKDSDQNQNQPFLRPIHLHRPNPGPSYYPPYPDPFPYGIYPPQPQPYQDPYAFQIHRRPPPSPNWYPPPPPHYPNQMTRPYPGGQYVDIGSDIVDPHSYFPATPSRYSDVPPYSPVSSHHRGEKLATPFSPPPVSNYNNSSVSSPGPRGAYGRWPSDLDSEMGGAFARGYVKKAVSDSDARRCHPLAGGAPFIACHSCFELLYLPKKKLLAQERQHKLQCGACSEVITFTIVDKKLVFSSGSHEETNPVSLEVEDRITTNAVAAEELSSADVNKSSSDLPCKQEEEPIQESRNYRDTPQSVQSAASQCSDDEDRSSISSEQQQKEVKSVRRRAKGSKAPEPANPENASLLELFEYSNVNRAALAYGMAQMGYNKPDKQESFMKQDSLKPESVATETEVSYNGYSNTEISEDSRYSNGREDSNNNRPRSQKGSESGFTETTTRSSTDRTEEQGKSLEVWVNGHLIPEELVSSAGKLAGPVQAGKYW